MKGRDKPESVKMRVDTLVGLGEDWTGGLQWSEVSGSSDRVWDFEFRFEFGFGL
jgi:hypothetical protein